MTSTQAEICRIRAVSVKRGGILGVGVSFRLYFVAEAMTPSGVAVVGKSEESEFHIGTSRAEQTYDLLHQQLVQQLLSDGWEPVGTDQFGRVMSLKRSKRQTMGELNPTELLKQLGSLRAAGILTQEEFEKKKAEVLKRL